MLHWLEVGGFWALASIFSCSFFPLRFPCVPCWFWVSNPTSARCFDHGATCVMSAWKYTYITVKTAALVIRLGCDMPGSCNHWFGVITRVFGVKCYPCLVVFRFWPQKLSVLCIKPSSPAENRAKRDKHGRTALKNGLQQGLFQPRVWLMVGYGYIPCHFRGYPNFRKNWINGWRCSGNGDK